MENPVVAERSALAFQAPVYSKMPSGAGAVTPSVNDKLGQQWLDTTGKNVSSCIVAGNGTDTPGTWVVNAPPAYGHGAPAGTTGDQPYDSYIDTDTGNTYHCTVAGSLPGTVGVWAEDAINVAISGLLSSTDQNIYRYVWNTWVKNIPQLGMRIVNQAAPETLYFNGISWGVEPSPAVTNVVAIDALTGPPAANTAGDIYVVAKTATGTWAGHENCIAFCTASGSDTTATWSFTPLVAGQQIIFSAGEGGYLPYVVAMWNGTTLDMQGSVYKPELGGFKYWLDITNVNSRR